MVSNSDVDKAAPLAYHGRDLDDLEVTWSWCQLFVFIKPHGSCRGGSDEPV